MNWEPSAEEALKRVPIFVRKMVRNKVEEYALGKGCSAVSIAEVEEARQAFKSDKSPSSGTDPQKDLVSFDDGNITAERVERLENLSEERGVIKTACSIVRVCGAPFGCPRQVMNPGSLWEKLVEHLERSGYKEHLEANIEGHILTHHKFRVSLAGCPNACSQPQIVDFGVIGHSVPDRTNEPCTECRECVAACHEGAIEVIAAEPIIDYLRCAGCGDCARACPTGTLTDERKGYTILVGGRLGRHPQFAEEIIDLAIEEEVLAAFDTCIALYREHARGAERFSSVYNRLGAEAVRSGIENRMRPSRLPFDAEGDEQQ